MIKVDLFVFTETPLARQEMARRQILPIPGEPEAHLHVATPEDTILQKLLWYRKGGGTSERQWTDILGVIKVQGRALDLSYLKEWAERSGVEDLLAQVLTDSGMRQ
jgi:hypothetical protein